MNRRNVLKAITASIAIARELSVSPLAEAQAPAVKHFRQGITRQVFGNQFSMEDCCREAAKIGFTGFDFADNPSDWPTLKKYGLLQTMLRADAPQANAGGAGGRGRGAKPIGWEAIGWKEAMGDYLKAVHEDIDTCAANGFPNFLLQAGERSDTFTEGQGADNAVAFCNEVKRHAEDKNVTLCLEILNSRGPGYGIHPTSLFDHTKWGVEVVKRVNSPRVRILFDIWQADVMEGDVVATIRNNIQYIGHFHTGGVPGRHQIDDTQELNYRFIAKAIADLGYTGYITHEWSPSQGSDPIATAKRAFEVMNV